VEKSLWKSLWTCRKADCGMVILVLVNGDSGYDDNDDDELPLVNFQ
jgi:hypothetical protein